MSKLNDAARTELAIAGISVAAWSRRFTERSTWAGDVCGCPDDRCIGHHHAAEESCGCLRALIREYTAAQEASTSA